MQYFCALSARCIPIRGWNGLGAIPILLQCIPLRECRSKNLVVVLEFAAVPELVEGTASPQKNPLPSGRGSQPYME